MTTQILLVESSTRANGKRLLTHAFSARLVQVFAGSQLTAATIHPGFHRRLERTRSKPASRLSDEALRHIAQSSTLNPDDTYDEFGRPNGSVIIGNYLYNAESSDLHASSQSHQSDVVSSAASTPVVSMGLVYRLWRLIRGL